MSPEIKIAARRDDLKAEGPDDLDDVGAESDSGPGVNTDTDQGDEGVDRDGISTPWGRMLPRPFPRYLPHD